MLRKVPLKRRKRLSRKPKRPRPHVDRDARAAWRDAARNAPCALCAASSRVEGHHLIPQRHLKERARTERLTGQQAERERWDRRNLLPLCRPCHERHERGFLPVPRALLSPAAHAFAREVGLEASLDRLYPPEETQE